MADEKVTIETDIETEASIAKLRDLKKKLREITDPTEFKRVQQQIDDMTESINAGRVGAGNFAEVLGTLPGPIGDIAGRAGGLIGSLKQFGQLKLTDLKSSLVELGKDVVDIGKSVGDLTGITKIYNTIASSTTKILTGLGVAEQTAATGARAFAGALTATGIGAIVVGLGLLIANWDKVKDAIKGATAESKTYEEAQVEVTKSLTDFNKKLFEVNSSFKAAKEGTITKEEALKKYNDTLGSTVGYAGSLEQAEQLLSANTATVVESIKLRAQAQVFYAKSAEAAAKAASGEGVDPSFWETVGNSILSLGNSTQFALNQAKTIGKNYGKLSQDAQTFAKEGDVLTQKAIENDKKLKEGLAKPPDTTQVDNKRKTDLETIKKNSEDATLILLDERKRAEKIIITNYDNQIALAKKYGKSTKELEDAKEKELQDLRAKFAKEDIDKQNENNRKKREQLDKDFKTAEAQLNQKRANELISEEEYQLALKDLRIKYASDQVETINAEIAYTEFLNGQRDKRKDKAKEEADKQLEYNKQIKQSWIDLGDNISNSFSQLAGVFEEGSDIAKAFAITSVVIGAATSIAKINQSFAEQISDASKAVGANASIVTQGIGLLGNPITAGIGTAMIATGTKGGIAAKALLIRAKVSKGLQIGSVVASSAAQLAAIMSAKKGTGATVASGGAGGGGENPAPPPTYGGAPASIPAPQIQTNVGATPQTQIAQTLSQATQRPIQAFVVSTSMSSQQALDRRTNAAATFGG